MVVAQQLLYPRIGKTSQMGKFVGQAREIGLMHDQHAIIKVETFAVVPPIYRPRDVEGRYCFCALSLVEAIGKGDDARLPYKATLSGKGFPAYGFFDVLMRVHSNGQWRMEVLEIIEQVDSYMPMTFISA